MLFCGGMFWIFYIDYSINRPSPSIYYCIVHVLIQELEEAIKVHQSTVASLNASGGEIIDQSSAPDSSLLTEKRDSLNQRWRMVCTEVADRKER